MIKIVKYNCKKVHFFGRNELRIVKIEASRFTMKNQVNYYIIFFKKL